MISQSYLQRVICEDFTHHCLFYIQNIATPYNDYVFEKRMDISSHIPVINNPLALFLTAGKLPHSDAFHIHTDTYKVPEGFLQ